VAALALLALAGCGGDHHRGVTGPPAPSLASTCAGQSARVAAAAAWLRTSDGVRLYSVSAGSGPTAVVLAHESGGAGVCGWLPTIRFLTAHGLRVVAFDFRGTYPSPYPATALVHHWLPDLQAAVDAAHADGAKHAVLMGASFGGAVSVADAARLRGIDAVISLSGELKLPASAVDAIDDVPQLRLPLLVIAARDDAYFDAADARRLVAAAGSTDKRAAIFAGSYHGWDLLDLAPYRARVRALILRFLRARG
jgi:alpha-beta hydrolase superfamily lysophospholipase